MLSPEAEESLLQTLAALKGWPLNKRETFTAFALMGLTSRLQPSTTSNRADQERLVKLANDLGEMAAAPEKEGSDTPERTLARKK